MIGQGAERETAGRLRALRASLGLSQEQLARRLGVSFATVNRWESGRTQLSPRAAQAVADLEAELAAPARAGPAAGAGSAPGPQRAPLPLAQTSFIGREQELADLASVLQQARLVSLVGPGGSCEDAARG